MQLLCFRSATQLACCIAERLTGVVVTVMTPQMLSDQSSEGNRTGLATAVQAKRFKHKMLIIALERALQMQFPAKTVW